MNFTCFDESCESFTIMLLAIFDNRLALRCRFGYDLLSSVRMILVARHLVILIDLIFIE